MNGISNYIILFLFTLSCSNVSTSTSDEQNSNYIKVKNFYNLAKNKNIEIFYNVVIMPRGKNQNDTTNKVYRIALIINNDKQIKIPVWSDSSSKCQMEADSFYKENVSVYSRYFHIPKNELYDSIKDYSSSIINLYNDLGVHEIISRPELGKIILFNIDNNTQLAYVPDTSKIYHSYWKKYINENVKLGPNWYYRFK